MKIRRLPMNPSPNLTACSFVWRCPTYVRLFEKSWYVESGAGCYFPSGGLLGMDVVYLYQRGSVGGLGTFTKHPKLISRLRMGRIGAGPGKCGFAWLGCEFKDQG